MYFEECEKGEDLRAPSRANIEGAAKVKTK